MHEFSICRNIVDVAISEYNNISPKPEKLIAVRITIGRLHQIVPETLESAYEILTKGTIAENSRVEIQFIEVCCKCTACSWEGTIDYPLFICKQCGSGDIDIIHGKEFYLENLEVEYTEPG